MKGVIQADFAFFDPKPKDFHGLKVLLQTYLDDKQWDLSGFVDIILEQTTVGSVVKIENDEDEGVYAFVSALNMGRYKASNRYLLPGYFCFTFLIFPKKLLEWVVLFSQFCTRIISHFGG